jgi:hypothetical protein
VQVCVVQGAPGCTIVDGQITVLNQSSRWWYRIDVSATCHGITCDPGVCTQTRHNLGAEISPRPCRTSGTPCSVTTSCFLRNCPGDRECGNCPTCDNTDCDNPVCLIVTGTVTGRAWSLDGVNWTPFSEPPEIPVGDGAIAVPCSASACQDP